MGLSELISQGQQPGDTLPFADAKFLRQIYRAYAKRDSNVREPYPRNGRNPMQSKVVANALVTGGFLPFFFPKIRVTFLFNFYAYTS